MFKVGDRVEAIVDGKNTGSFGTIVEISEFIVVDPDDWHVYAEYDLNNSNDFFKIKKVEITQ